MEPINREKEPLVYTHEHNFVLKHLQYRRLPLNQFGLVRLVAGIKTITVVFNTAFRIEKPSHSK